MNDKYNNNYEKGRLRIINKLIPLANGNTEKALDIGCGQGKLTLYLQKKGFEVTGVDTNVKQINAAQSLSKNYANLKFEIGDICSLKYPDNFFDICLCLEVIEHLEEPEEGLNEIYRILKLGGYLLISTPNKLSLEGIKGKIIELITGRKWKAWDDSHKKIFNSLEFIRLLKRSGFVPLEIVGYYYLPLKKPNFLNCLRYAAVSKSPINYLGFDIIAKCVKVEEIRKF